VDVTDELLSHLFASDLAQDVRAEFNERRGFGLSVSDATAAVVQAFGHLLERADEGPVVILAIASLQVRDGSIHPTFREAALELLRDSHGFELRAGENLQSRREREQLREQLIAAIEAAPLLEAQTYEDEEAA